MVRNAFADEHLLTYLHNVSKENTFSVGVILGQHISGKDYIIHFAKTPPITPTNNEENNDSPRIKSINDIHEEWVAEHARQATKMLPGGMHVLGLFIISSEDIMNPCQPKVKSILSFIQKQLDSNKYLFGNLSNVDKLILNYSTTTHQYSCKSYEISTGSLKPVDFKFLPKAMNWSEVECKFELDQLYPIGDGDGVEPLRRHMNIVLEKIYNKLNSARFLFDGELKNDDELIESVGKKKISKTNKSGNQVEDTKPIQICILQQCNEEDATFEVSETSNEIKICGHISTKLWLNPKFSIKDASNAIIEDILRSFNTRLDMHWDSLTEEEHAEEISSLHEPPRRVLIQLPHTSVAISDYLFPGEGPQDSKNSLEEVLDFKMLEPTNVIEVEGQADLTEYCNESLENENEETLSKPSTGVRNKFLYFIGLEIAFLILVLAFVIHYYSR